MRDGAALRHEHAGHSDLISGLEIAVQTQPKAATLGKWLGLVKRELSFQEFYVWAKQKRQLSYLTVDVTPVCDLVCEGMCYYHPDIDKRTKLVSDEVIEEAVFDAEARLGLRTLVVAGKEPFLNPRKLFSLLEAMGPARERGYTAGTITNGRHLSRHWAELRQLSDQGCLDFMDISLDSGIASQHDQIRGKSGTYDLAFSALCHASQELGAMRLGVSSVLRADNGDGLLALIENASPWTRHFFITPIQPPPFSAIPPMTADAVIMFLRRLHKTLSSLESGADLEITVLLPGLYVREAAREGLFEWQSLSENDSGTIYAAAKAGRHTVLYFLNVLPEQAWRVARIASDGAYLAHLHFMQAPKPSDHAVGYIQNESIETLYDKSMQIGSPFHQIIDTRQRHQCQGRECWSSCFGGWSVAENALLTRSPLQLQPKLCRKGQ